MVELKSPNVERRVKPHRDRDVERVRVFFPLEYSKGTNVARREFACAEVKYGAP